MNRTTKVDLTDRHRNHVARLIRDLSDVGWIPAQLPSDANLLANRQLVELITSHRSIRVRISIYKVGDRGEAHRLNERRIEITKTLASGLPRLRGWADVVLGYDFVNDAYVGLDPRRLGLGGKTHNASSSLDPAALVASSNSHILIRPHETPSLGVEYQAFFRPQRLGEYLFNYEAIHDGLYRGDGLQSGTMRRHTDFAAWALPSSACHGSSLVLTHNSSAVARSRPISNMLVEAFEIGAISPRRNITPEEFERIQRKCQEVGDGGEAFVYQSERRRLHNAGRSDLAGKIDWVSRKSIGKGFDILSFEIDGTSRFIEVKATVGHGSTFYVSGNEWRVANKLRKTYWIYRVVKALDGPRITTFLQDPFGADNAQNIARVADGWRVTIL